MITTFMFILACNTQKPVFNDIRAIEIKLQKYSHPKAVKPKKLAPAIMLLSDFYGVSPDLITRVLLLESRGRQDAVSRTHDSGLMQVNAYVAKNHGVSSSCLKDWFCNLQFGTYLLAQSRRPCAYNLGNRGSRTYAISCKTYERKLYENFN
jgi:soluble lytic murein transglycosylase-like protein